MMRTSLKLSSESEREKTNKRKNSRRLIDLSDDESDIDFNKYLKKYSQEDDELEVQEDKESDNNNKKDEDEEKKKKDKKVEDENDNIIDDSAYGKNEIILIQKENIESEDPKIMDFIKFCLEKRLFDDTFYDYGNAFSVMATKLPITFEKLTKDGKKIERRTFLKVFRDEFEYRGDIEYIYNCIKKWKKGGKRSITWDEFSDFFLPFVKYITY